MKERACLNCGAALEGKFCAACGQPDIDPEISLGQVFREFLDDAWSIDNRLLRGIRDLLLRPGHLTREYIAGRRRRHLSPFRLYLLCSLVFFGSVAITGRQLFQVTETGDVILRTGSSFEADSLQQADPPPVTIGANVGRTGSEDVLGQGNGRSPSDAPETGPIPSLSDTAAQPDTSAAAENTDMGKVMGRLSRVLGIASENPDRVNRDMVTWLPRLMFLLVPLFALMLRILYIRSRWTYLHHLMHALHLHALGFLMLGLILLVFPRESIVGKGIQAAMFPGLLVYQVVSMRRVYGGNLFATLGRQFLLNTGYTILLVMGLVSTVLVAVSLW